MSNIDVITGEVLDDMDKEVSEVVETIQSTEPEVKPKRTYNKKQVIDPIIPQETNQLIQGDVMEEVKVESPVETVAEVKVQDLVIEEVDEPEVDNSYADEEAPTENETFAAQIDTNALTEALKLKDVDVKVKALARNVVFDDNLTNELYNEFNSFLETKADIVADSGVKEVIPTGITLLDIALGGGFAVGAFHTIAGSPGSGKSMLSMQVVASAQRKYRGLLAGYLDSEEATSVQRLYNLGVRNPKIKPVTDITIEKVFKYLETVCLFKQQKKIEIPSIVIWDSIANTLSQKERETDDINSVIGYKARVLSLLVPKYVGKCAANNICWIAVNQLREELAMGPYSAPKDLRFLSNGKSLPGGTVLKYNAFTLLEMRASGKVESDKFGFDGIISKCTVVKNKIGPPGVAVELIGDFVNGFSDLWTSWYFLAKMKYIQTGAWNLLKAYPEKKIRTKDFIETYHTDERFKLEFDKLVLECAQAEILAKFSPVDEA